MKGPGRRRRPRPGPCGGVHGVHAARGARGVAGSSWQGLAQRELDDIGVAGVEGRLAIRQVEGPDAHEAFVKALGTHGRSEEHTSELQSPCNLVCRLLLEKKKIKNNEKEDYGCMMMICDSSSRFVYSGMWMYH